MADGARIEGKAEVRQGTVLCPTCPTVSCHTLHEQTYSDLKTTDLKTTGWKTCAYFLVKLLIF